MSDKGKKIKKKSDWTTYGPPNGPFVPCKPKKTYDVDEEERLCQLCLGDNESLALPDEVTNLFIDYVESGAPIPEVYVSVTANPGYDGDDATNLEFYIVKKAPRPNLDYDKQVKAYASARKEYELAKEKHKQELVEWKAWKKQEEERSIEKQIDAARLLLKRHGKL